MTFSCFAYESKYQALILGKSEYSFSFPTKESNDILGMNIDNNLNFHNYISLTCKKVNNQFNAMLRFRNLISKETLSNCIRPTYYLILIIAQQFGTFAVQTTGTKQKLITKGF